MAKSVVSIYIDETSLRLMVARGKRVEKWAYSPLEPGLFDDGAVVDEEKVAARIQELFKTLEVKTNRVITGLSGLHCLARSITLPKLPEAVLPEAVTQEAIRIMPVQLDQFYLSWQVISTSKEEMQVFMAASPRNATDALISTLQRAGLDPYFIGLKPLALARLANKPTAMVIDAQATEFDIVIMVDRVPQLVRTISFPSKVKTLAEKLSAISRDLEQTINFYNSSYSEKPLDSETPIFISGEVAEEPEAYQSLANKLGYPVLPLSLPLACPEGLAPSQYMVNSGLALKELSIPKSEGNLSLVNLNLLPEAYKPKPVSLTKTLLVPAAIVIAIGLLVPMVMNVQNAFASTKLLKKEMDAMNQVIEQRLEETKALKEEIAELEAQVEETESALAAFNAVNFYIEDRQYVVNGDLEVITTTLPDTINLRTITHGGDALRIGGVAPSEVEVLAYARDLRDSGRFPEVIVSTLAKNEQDSMDFMLTLVTGG